MSGVGKSSGGQAWPLVVEEEVLPDGRRITFYSRPAAPDNEAPPPAAAGPGPATPP